MSLTVLRQRPLRILTRYRVLSKKKKQEPVVFEPLRTPLIDSHCHVVPRTYGEELPHIIQRMFEGGALERAVNIGAGYGLEGNEQALEVFQAEPRLHPTIGIHPHDARLFTEDPQLADKLLRMAARPEVVAYGEVGLDYYYEHSDRQVQQEALRTQVEIARQVGKPLIVHDRDSHEDMLSILDECRAWELGVVIHCFSGDWTLAQACLARGAYLSIPGIVTYKTAEMLQEVAMRMPLERMFIETDSPYLAPVPYRGKRNEPAYVHAVARELARLRGEDVEHLIFVTAENARRFFGLPAGSDVLTA